MDEMKIKLQTRFMRGLVAKIIKKAISKKLGYKIDIHLNEIAIKTVDGNVYLHTDLDAEMSKDEFAKLIKNSGLNEEA